MERKPFGDAARYAVFWKPQPYLGWGSAFLKPYAGKTYFRVYHITCGQLMGIREQEGDSKNWYGRIVFLGFGKDDVPVFTLTSAVLNNPNCPPMPIWDFWFAPWRKKAGRKEKSPVICGNRCAAGKSCC